MGSGMFQNLDDDVVRAEISCGIANLSEKAHVPLDFQVKNRPLNLLQKPTTANHEKQRLRVIATE